MTKEQNQPSGDSSTTGLIVKTTGNDITEEPDKKAAEDLDTTRPPQQGVTHSQDQNSGPTKPSEKGSDPTTKIIIGLGILLLFMAFGPLILPEMVGMGAIGSAVMATAGAGLLAYGASKALSDTKESPSTSNSSRQQPRSSQNPQQSSQQSPQQNPQQSPAAVNDLTPIIEELSSNNTVDTSDVDAQRENLMDKLALSDNLKDMVKNNPKDDKDFEKNFDIHLKKFLKNMGEETKSKEGMGNQFFINLDKNHLDEGITFIAFRDNMISLLKKKLVINKSQEALIAEKEALETAITTIDELKRDNRSSKEELDKSKSFRGVDKEKKIDADGERLGNLIKANEKIDQANKTIFRVSSLVSSSPTKKPPGNGRQ